MKKTTLLLTLGLCFGISGLAQTKKQPTKRPRTATKQSAKPKQTRKAKPPTSSKAARKQSAKPKRSTVNRPQRPTRTQPQRPTSNRSAVKKPGRNSISLPTAPTADKAGSVQFSAEVDSLLKATPLFVKLDTNRNGSISKRELQMMSNISKSLDTNNDKKLSAVEVLGNAKGFDQMRNRIWNAGYGDGLQAKKRTKKAIIGNEPGADVSVAPRKNAGLVKSRKAGNESAAIQDQALGLILPAVQNAVPSSKKAKPTRGRPAKPSRKPATANTSNLAAHGYANIVGVIIQKLGPGASFEDVFPRKADMDFNDIFTVFDTNNDNKLSTAELFSSGSMTPQGDRPNP